VHSSAQADTILDVTGYFVGDGPPAPFAPLDLCDGTLTPPPAQPGSAPSVGSHSFLFVSPPPPAPGFGRWDPCRPQIEYAVNTLRATQREVDEMTHAIREIEKATGFDFVPYKPDPTTTEGLDDRRPPSGADFLIAFADPAAVPQLAGGVLGFGGGFWFSTTGRINTGFVIVDVPQLGNVNNLRTTLIHEFGHAMGLDHVGDAGQIMFPSLTSITSLRNGDKQGLWRVGAAQACTPDLSRPAAGDPVLVERPFGSHDAVAGG